MARLSSDLTENVEGGFAPPPYPYARLSRLSEVADSLDGGVVDLSIGTPCDPAPAAVVEAMASSGSEHGYPSSAGGQALREAAARWIERRFAARVDPKNVAACVGTKELVASTASYLRLRDPSRDVVIAPGVAYPTYAIGAQLAGCEVMCLPESPDGGVDLSHVPREVARRSVMVWLNSPSNPTGSLSDLGRAASWGREHGVPVFSDECYVEFTWDPHEPSTILQARDGRGDGADLHGGVVAVHSLSKRSNMAGMRVGFYAGDADLVGYLSAVRQHAGLMVPGPVQAAAVAALDDDAHVAVQRDRYRRRLERLAEILAGAGLDPRMPSGGFYLWVPVPPWAEREARRPAGPEEGPTASWVLAEVLAKTAG
ncbi:MAG: aminotransferase class I/II-fold pyridoxal phosphate-dependent enzyme, partial [Acidimicrobiales bacterium]